MAKFSCSLEASSKEKLAQRLRDMADDIQDGKNINELWDGREKVELYDEDED